MVTPGSRLGASTGPLDSCSVHRIPSLVLKQSYPSIAIPTFARGLASSPKTKNRKNGDLAQQEKWLEALESTAYGPLLFDLSTEDVDRLKRAFSLIHRIILYLARPFESRKKAEQFQTAFHVCVVSPASEIGCARRAVLNIAQAAIHNLSSISEASHLRSENLFAFSMLPELMELNPPSLATPRGHLDAESWKVYWGRAEPLLMMIAVQLDMKGYGLLKTSKIKQST